MKPRQMSHTARSRSWFCWRKNNAGTKNPALSRVFCEYFLESALVQAPIARIRLFRRLLVREALLP